MQGFRVSLVVFCCISGIVQGMDEVGTADLSTMSLEALLDIHVNIATGTPNPIRYAPASTSVVTAADAEAMASQDMVEMLEAVPGLHVSRGSFFYSPRFYIRGVVSSFNPQTLVLVNGVPMTSLFVGDRFGLHHGLPVKTEAMIERVEIIRGPGSAVYGADAFAGVINIITRNPEDHVENQATLTRGSFDTTIASLRQRAQLGSVALLASLNYEGSDGPDAVIERDLQTGFDNLGFAPPASLAPGPVNLMAEDYEVRLDLSWGDFLLHTQFGTVRNNGTAQGVLSALDPKGRWQDERTAVDLSWSPVLSEQWALENRISYTHSNVFATEAPQVLPPGALFGAFPSGARNLPALKEENARLDLAAVYDGGKAHRLRFGSGFYWGDVYETRDLANFVFDPVTGQPIPLGTFERLDDTNNIFLPENHRTSYYVFAQDEWQIAQDWHLTTGVRYDHYSDFGSTTNPRAGLVWDTLPWLTSKLLYGEAFRPPAFLELYGLANPAVTGNPDLEAEKLRSVELAFSVSTNSSWRWDTNLYHLRIRDFIDFVARPGSPVRRAENAGRVRGFGAETELHYRFGPSLQLVTNYSYQNTEDEKTGEPMGLAPRDEAFLRAIWVPHSDWQLAPQVTWVGKRKRQAGDSREDLGGYTTIDLTVRRLKLPGNAELALIGRNLFDADVREPSPVSIVIPPSDIPDDLPQAGVSVMLEGKVRW